MQLKKYIETHAPEVLVTGGEYPVPQDKQRLAQLIQIVQMAAIAFIIFGE
jgi:selT/selW/selH-like putative selenoprotein